KEDIEEKLAGDELTYPVVLKPVRSRVKSGDRWISTAVDYAKDRSELESKLMGYVTEVYPVILQE
ncbi:MAG: hypothetical protein ABW138_07955, partial [Candidatus Thiodiazotropha sp. 4PDIVS1]